MLSFSPRKNLEDLKAVIEKINSELVFSIKEEYFFLYPHVVEGLTKSRLRPLMASAPGGIQKKFV